MSRVKGNIAEDKAVHFLEKDLYCIVDRNFYSRFGEIDIVAIKDDVLHFIEVKSGNNYEVAIENITPRKVARIIKTLNIYLKKYNLDVEYSVDAVIVTPDEVLMVENITV